MDSEPILQGGWLVGGGSNVQRGLHGNHYGVLGAEPEGAACRTPSVDSELRIDVNSPPHDPPAQAQVARYGAGIVGGILAGCRDA